MLKFFSIAACCALFASSAAAAQQANEVEMGNAIRKGVDQRVDDRLKQFEQRQAAVTSKPGDYAQRSERYTVYLANCKSLGMTPALRDEAARKFDAMSETEFRKQVDRCPQRSQDQAEAANVQLAQRRGTDIDVDINIGGRPGYGRPAYGRGAYSDANLDRALAQRALQVLGPAPTARHSFQGVKRTHQAVPRGCTERAVKVSGGTYYRVVCP